MRIREGARTPVRFVILFVLMAGIPLAVLGWAALWTLREDRESEEDRLKERLKNAAEAVAAGLEQGLSSWEELAAAADKRWAIPPGAAVVLFDENGVVARYGAALPYYPQIAPRTGAPSGVFEDAEAKEFHERNFAEAAGLYRQLAELGDSRVRAGALMGLARCLHQQRRFDEALATYGHLAAMGSVPVGSGGDPSELVARRGRLMLFETVGKRDAREREAALLAAALSQGRFMIDRATFDAYSADVPLALQSQLPEAVDVLWPRWRQRPSGRAAWQGDTNFIAVWRPAQEGTAAMVGSLETLMASASASYRNSDLQVALEDSSARAIWGKVLAGGPQARSRLAGADLPWTILVTANGAAISGNPARRNFLTAGFGLMALVIAAASFFVFRALTREYRVARLQSDFVSAVSHEFRSPLAAMRHLTDLLEEGDVPPDRLVSFYRGLGTETRRLQAMVESLLDFAKLESGRRVYDMQDTNVAELAKAVVDEFREQRRLCTGRLEWRQPGAEPCIRADRDALSLAIRNLLDNAVKYSLESAPVSVSVADRDGCTQIAVEDRGAGLGVQEQRDIFQRFVRGQAARTLNVKGTGIGLTMAQDIVKAHGGRIEVASELGHGSLFTIVLPLAPATASQPANPLSGQWKAS